MWRGRRLPSRCVALTSRAAFFLSIEFQATGGYVYNAHKAAFGNLPGLPVPVRRESFMPETRSLANGFIVGEPGWEAKINANKDAYVLAFVERGDFQAAFPGSMTAAAVRRQALLERGASPRRRASATPPSRPSARATPRGARPRCAW